MKGEHTVNDVWLQGEQFIQSASGLFVTLCFVCNQEKIINKLLICIVISLNIIIERLSIWICTSTGTCRATSMFTRTCTKR